jgi:hypothetical protein
MDRNNRLHFVFMKHNMTHGIKAPVIDEDVRSMPRVCLGAETTGTVVAFG